VIKAIIVCITHIATDDGLLPFSQVGVFEVRSMRFEVRRG
jgi:hypothetical protein